jgi:hypothetical protein
VAARTARKTSGRIAVISIRVYAEDERDAICRQLRLGLRRGAFTIALAGNAWAPGLYRN